MNNFFASLTIAFLVLLSAGCNSHRDVSAPNIQHNPQINKHQHPLVTGTQPLIIKNTQSTSRCTFPKLNKKQYPPTLILIRL